MLVLCWVNRLCPQSGGCTAVLLVSEEIEAQVYDMHSSSFVTTPQQHVEIW